jgi:hypothetical protein
MKIYINRKPVEGPWGGGNLFVKAFYEYLPESNYNIVDNPLKDIPDIIFLQSPKPDSTCNFSINNAIFLKNKYPSIKIIMRVNDCDARKATVGVDNMWIECSKYIDKTVFVSSWMKEYFLKKGWACKKNYILYNGVNFDHFKPNEKIKNGKINIVTHHWSNNRMKGFDVYEKLDEYVGKNSNKYTFTYIGRDLGTFKNTNVIAPLFGKSLGEELSTYDLYVSASKFDPGPNHILESLACNLPTFVCKDGGGAVELAGNSNIFEKYSDLLDMIEDTSYVKNKFSSLCNWKTCVKNLDKILRK